MLKSDIWAVDCLRIRNGVRSIPIITTVSFYRSRCLARRYTPDAVDGIDNVVWLADSSLLDPITDVSTTLRIIPSRRHP